MKKVISLLLMTLMFTGCSQDPLEGKSENIRDSKPEGSQKPGEGLGRHIFVLEMPEDVTFVIDQEKEIKINTRIVTVDLPYEVIMHGLPEGASFDSDTSTFTWKPGAEDLSADKAYTLLPLEVEMMTTEEPIIKSRETIKILLIRDLNYVPEIVDISPIKDMTEGENQDFTVRVEDKFASEDFPPQLSVLPIQGKRDISAYIDLTSGPKRNKSTPNHWDYKLSIDLGDAELTGSNSDFSFGVMARSQSTGKVTMKTSSLRIFSLIKKPITTWLEMDVPTFNTKIQNKYSFHVSVLPSSDGSFEGYLTNVEFVNDCSTLPGIASCECKLTDAFIRAVCSIEYTPVVEVEQEFNFVIETNAQNGIGSRTDQFLRKIKVLP